MDVLKFSVAIIHPTAPSLIPFAPDFFVFLFFFIAISVRRFRRASLRLSFSSLVAQYTMQTRHVSQNAWCVCCKRSVSVSASVCVFYSFFFFPSGLSLVVIFIFDIEIFWRNFRKNKFKLSRTYTKK